MNLGAPELLVIVLGLIPLIPIVWTVVDATTHPDWAWQQIGQTKAVWIAVPLVSIIVCGGILGLVMFVIYLASIRPQLLRAQGRI